MAAATVYQKMARQAGRPLRYIGRNKTGDAAILTTGNLRPGEGGGRVSAPATTGAGGATAVAGGSDIMDLYTAALERLSTGGMALEASLADIEEGKKQAIARGQQSLVSGGLAGTTVMGGVPIAAEKVAGRARLGARGEAESKYLTTLASYAAFAQRAQLASADRAAALQRLQLQLGTQERMAGQSRGGGVVAGQSEVGGPSYTAMYGGGMAPSTPTTMVSGLGPTTQRYSQQFPSIYNQGETEEQTPNWTSGSAPGGPTYMRGAGYSESEIARYYG